MAFVDLASNAVLVASVGLASFVDSVTSGVLEEIAEVLAPGVDLGKNGVHFEGIVEVLFLAVSAFVGSAEMVIPALAGSEHHS